jgi:hypothetical protein
MTTERSSSSKLHPDHRDGKLDRSRRARHEDHAGDQLHHADRRDDPRFRDWRAAYEIDVARGRQ